MKNKLKRTMLKRAVAMLVISGALFLLIVWRQKIIYIPLNDFYALLAERINSGEVRGSYLLKVSGKCSFGDDEIFVPRIAGGNSLSAFEISSYLWPRPVSVKKVSGNVEVVSWPGFSSKIIRSSIDGMRTNRTSFESPGTALERLLLSEGFRAETSRQNIKPLIALASGLTAVYPENPMPVQDLKQARNLEDAMVSLARHFGGVTIYAECHGRGKGLYDVRYLSNDYQKND